jgi:hypothetical protein
MLTTVWHWTLTILSWLLVAASVVTLVARRIPDATVAGWEKTRPRLANALRFCRAVGSDLDKALPALWCLITGTPWPAILARATQASPPAPAPRAPAAGAGAAAPLAVLALVGALGAVLEGCPPIIREPALEPPPAGCDAGATLCHQGAPWRCGPGGRWSQSDRRCDRLGTDATAVVCCPTPSALRPGVLVHACVPSSACAEVQP